jgi:tRNA pseudouridine32 synthase/23S rRNA pseudouridine746 synthase/23S rRNA pseudouridine1911/1915/1917 synthase
MQHLRIDLGLFVKSGERRRKKKREGASAPSLALDPNFLAELRARILYRDRNLIVLDKPAGLAVHPGPATPDSLERYLPRLLAEAGGTALRAAHRLDRDTSGCLVIARRKSALSRLSRLFAEGLIEKVYWAVVVGSPEAAEGEIALPLAKRSGRGGWRMVHDPAGLPALTRYRILGQGGGLTLLECRPKTGRTHQIRAHCAALGCPVLDDPIYGQAGQGAVAAGPHHLLARRIAIPQEIGPPIEAAAPLPPHMRDALSRASVIAPAAP